MRISLQSLLRHLLAPALVLAAASAVAAPTYTAHVIAPVARHGGIETFWYTAIDLNNQGMALVEGFQYANYGSNFSTYDQRGRYVRNVGGYSPRYGGSYRYAINNFGDVVGSQTHSNHIWAGSVLMDQGFGASVHGFPEDEYDGFFTDAWGYGLSDAGHVTGRAKGPLDGRERAYLWRDKVMVEIGTFGGATSTGMAVNNDGVVAGQADLADGRVHAFRYSAGQMTDLGTFGGANSWAYGINARGHVVGTAEQADGSRRAFIHARGALQLLPTPEGASAGAWSINKHSHAVGAYTLDGQQHAFYFDGRAVHRLQDLLAAADKATWSIASVAAINDKGWILVDAHNSTDEHSTVLLLKPAR